MTFKVADIANDAQLVEIADRLSEALSGEGTAEKPLDLSADCDFACNPVGAGCVSTTGTNRSLL
jgi:hypothetical protein